MATPQGKSTGRGTASDAVQEGLSDVRTTVLGPQILLGFQYEAIFQPAFASLPPWRQELSLAAFVLLVATVVLVIAPAGHHQIAARGQRTWPQAVFSRQVMALSLCPFALAIGLNIVVAAGGELGPRAGAVIAAATAGLALFLWYGIEWMLKRPRATPRAAPEQPKTPLKDRIADLMTETRIVLPGVQALLGFQFAAYLSNIFPKLSTDARIAHDLSLVLLLLSMILLMTPAPFHRLAEGGQDTERVCKVGAACIVTALATLALAIAADFYVAVAVITGDASRALAAGAAAAAAGFGLWFAAPLLSRRPRSAQRVSSRNPGLSA